MLNIVSQDACLLVKMRQLLSWRHREQSRMDSGFLRKQKVSAETEGFCEGSLAALADDVGIGIDGSSNCRRKMILFNTQSINGL